MARRILIVEDDKQICDLLSHYLRKEGFQAVPAPDGETGFARAKELGPDLVLLDILLPGMDGLELLRRIRTAPELRRTPVIMLTAKGDETDRIVGLELGADDYIPKPFSPREVVARIKAVLRRAAAGESAPAARRYVYGDIALDVERHEVLASGKPVHLTTKEFRILSAFLSAPGRVLSREAILARVWGEGTYVTDRTVDVHVAKIRRKIPLLAEAIETVPDAGYRLREK